MMKALLRCFAIQMAVYPLCRRPGDLERNEQHEKDGKETTHGVSLVDYSIVVMPKRAEEGQPKAFGSRLSGNF